MEFFYQRGYTNTDNYRTLQVWKHHGALVLLFMFLSAVSASVSECPVQDKLGCYCWTKYLSDNHMYCEFLGTLGQVPKFSSSNETFDTFTIRYNSSLRTIQSNAFLGLKIKVLNLQKLGTMTVSDGAFNGLQDVLEELHMDDNKITSIGPDVLTGLKHLRYLGLHNNMLSSVPTANGSEGLMSVEYIHIFNNNITHLHPSSFSGMPFLRGVSVANNRISSLPKGLFTSLPHLTQLDISKNKLTELDFPFSHLHKLLHLRMDNNFLSSLPEGVFANLTVLTHLYLHDNRLKELTRDIFSNNTELEHLDVSSNVIAFIDNESFRNLPKLKTLYLQDNMIKTLPIGVFDALVSLQRLHLTKNRLHNINIFTAPLRSMWDLQISDNKIAQLQNELFANLSNLQMLDLSINRLRLTKGCFMGLASLKSISLSMNPLYIVPAYAFSSLVSLERLFLSSSDIDTFEENCFNGLSNLTFLDLTHNGIATFPIMKPIFNDTPNLHILKLSHNKIINLHKAYLFGLKGLSFLYLDYNGLSTIAPESFLYLEKLSKLHIRHNGISILNPQSFARLHSLQELDLSYNKLQGLPRGLFEFFSSLKTLSLAHNLLSRMSWRELADIYNIEELDLSDNRLQTMNDDQLINKQRLRHVKLTGNKFDCRGCRMGRLRMLNITMVDEIDKLQCYTPYSRKGDLLACYDLGYCGVYYKIVSTDTMKKYCALKDPSVTKPTTTRKTPVSPPEVSSATETQEMTLTTAAAETNYTDTDVPTVTHLPNTQFEGVLGIHFSRAPVQEPFDDASINEEIDEYLNSVSSGPPTEEEETSVSQTATASSSPGIPDSNVSHNGSTSPRSATRKDFQTAVTSAITSSTTSESGEPATGSTTNANQNFISEQSKASTPESGEPRKDSTTTANQDVIPDEQKISTLKATELDDELTTIADWNAIAEGSRESTISESAEANKDSTTIANQNIIPQGSVESITTTKSEELEKDSTTISNQNSIPERTQLSDDSNSKLESVSVLAGPQDKSVHPYTTSDYGTLQELTTTSGAAVISDLHLLESVGTEEPMSISSISSVSSAIILSHSTTTTDNGLSNVGTTDGDLSYVGTTDSGLSNVDHSTRPETDHLTSVTVSLDDVSTESIFSEFHAEVVSMVSLEDPPVLVTEAPQASMDSHHTNETLQYPTSNNDINSSNYLHEDVSSNNGRGNDQVSELSVVYSVPASDGHNLKTEIPFQRSDEETERPKSPVSVHSEPDNQRTENPSTEPNKVTATMALMVSESEFSDLPLNTKETPPSPSKELSLTLESHTQSTYIRRDTEAVSATDESVITEKDNTESATDSMLPASHLPQFVNDTIENDDSLSYSDVRTANNVSLNLMNSGGDENAQGGSHAEITSIFTTLEVENETRSPDFRSTSRAERSKHTNKGDNVNTTPGAGKPATTAETPIDYFIYGQNTRRSNSSVTFG